MISSQGCSPHPTTTSPASWSNAAKSWLKKSKLTMNNFKPYPKYKDSGVEWLGEVPEDWKALPTKRLFKYKKDINADRQEGNILSLTYRGVVNNSSENPEGLVPKDYATYQIFEPLDLAFKLIDLENIKTSRVGLVHERGAMSPAYIRLEPQKEISPKFAYYYFYSLYQRAIFNQLGAGVRSTLGPTDLGELIFIAPSESEQIAIANFLDEKVGKIDAAIAQKERLIELLNERKQIIIQNAVTKGLNPKAPMRDSGIEWIGEIPEHWEVKRLKYILKERNERSETGEEPLLMMSQVHGLVKRSDYHDKAEVAQTAIGNKRVYENDLVFNKLKAHLGVFFKSSIQEVGIVSPDYAVYYADKKISDLKYLELLFRNPAYIGQFICKATGIVEGLIRLYTDDLYSIYVPVPPKDELPRIISEVENRTAAFAKSIRQAEDSIEKLKEYKATLINSAVTGKIDVSSYEGSDRCAATCT